MRNSILLFFFWNVYCCFAAGSPTPLGPEGPLEDELPRTKEVLISTKPSVKFNLRTSKDAEHEGCYFSAGHDQLLEDCGFNVTAKTFFVIHGWTMSGMFENWLHKLVSALQTREKDANVVVVDWLPLAHQLYIDAVSNIGVVGHSVAKLLDWLQGKNGFSLGNVHLIGYSLGAHVAGYAGNFVKGTVGRITGLDPAGPMFEGADINKRLSPDDADFVDVLHTYTRSFGVSIGIQMPVGHIDIYPNGGDFQPGCGLNDILGSIASGMYHYQMKIHIFSYKNSRELEPTFYVTLYGTNADSQTLPLEIVEQINLNATNTFLVYTEEDLGDLLKIKLTWERPAQSWYNLWKELRTYLSQPSNPSRELHIRRIRVKSGETQQKFTFCAEDPENTSISPGQELSFRKCKDGWQMKNETSPTVVLA
ncbi:endothelial lipase isoform X2 [Perognathus longimembris pacificus]|uniref:endothelial lipase isoform X2 n=1 Tax=Perognathus longimembris pacificus TaxID=214514 RepID=UPI002018A165|nr:endothelial lipase isoform X2 [Perognathus longimembris pacificus]